MEPISCFNPSRNFTSPATILLLLALITGCGNGRPHAPQNCIGTPASKAFSLCEDAGNGTLSFQFNPPSMSPILPLQAQILRTDQSAPVSGPAWEVFCKSGPDTIRISTFLPQNDCESQNQKTFGWNSQQINRIVKSGGGLMVLVLDDGGDFNISDFIYVMSYGDDQLRYNPGAHQVEKRDCSPRP